MRERDMDDEEEELERIAGGFDGDQEDTSPEVVRHGARPGVDTGGNPTLVVASKDAGLRKELRELLCSDGWHAVEARTIDELLEFVRHMGPQVALVDADFDNPGGPSVPETLRSSRPGSAIRVVALLHSADTDEVATAVVGGFDDFVMNPNNHVEVLARATANLRASRSVAEVYRQGRDLASLLELSQTLASSLDLNLILHTVSRLIAKVISAERCSIVLLDPERRDAVMVAASEDRTVRDLRLNLDNYPELNRCVETASPVFIEDASQDPLLFGVREQLAQSGVRLMMLFPIVFEERVMGVLFLRSKESGRRLTPHEVQFGQTVASACAVAVRNARLFDSFRDQTERMNYMRLVAERQMESLKKYEDFFEYAADGMSIVDSAGEILYVNREGRRLLGREHEELRGASFLRFLADESKGYWPEVVDQVRHGRFRRSFDLYFVRGDGSERIFWLSAGGVGQETGLMILSFRDVTETREMELELRTTKEFLENLVDNSVDAIVAADLNGNIMLFNKGAEQIYGYRSDEVVGRLHVNDLYPEGVSAEVMNQLREERWGGRGRLDAQRKTILNKWGEVVPVSMTASIIYEDGEEVATVGVFTDLRDRLQMEQRLSEAEDELMKTERARVAAELAGMAAHELNQPLTSVLGYAEMLRHRVSEDSKVSKIVDTIYNQAERMAEIVRKIGRITKYETKVYGARTMMMDLERSSAPDQPREVTDRQAALSGVETDPSGGITGRFRAYVEGRGPGEAPDDESPSEPGPPPRIGGPQEGARLMAQLASMPMKRSQEEVTDPRYAIIRAGTIDEDLPRRRRADSAPFTDVPKTAEHTTPPPSTRASEEHTGRNRPAPSPPSARLTDKLGRDHPPESKSTQVVHGHDTLPE
jgi:PAS domain S-box-containing protein